MCNPYAWNRRVFNDNVTKMITLKSKTYSSFNIKIEFYDQLKRVPWRRFRMLRTRRRHRDEVLIRHTVARWPCQAYNYSALSPNHWCITVSHKKILETMCKNLIVKKALPRMKLSSVKFQWENSKKSKVIPEPYEVLSAALISDTLAALSQTPAYSARHEVHATKY